ncbi:cysteine proteinase [Athelia psychrophila]|uniref:Ubiquitin carboxyl-terminal hydrolase n=1 Tax=Athelia psychrophila TaxID=1759441 RepID=A0A166L6P5_9AGAM|nr:cysteine proteinase [Fibularhizoctonia sp. CBS 109695]
MEDASFSSGSQEDHTDSPNGLCTHLRATLSDEADREKLIGKYKNVVAWNVNRTQDALHAMKRRKISSPSCDTCHLVLSRPLACLECSYAGCWVSGHTVSHLKDSNHGYCVDVKTGTIFCADCDDFIYDPAMESIHLSTVVSAEEKQTKFQVAKKAREPFRQWIPGSKDASALDGSSVLPCKGSQRGLLNLGQTCFLNVVLQSFLHNPLLRGFFLSDKHNSALCASKVCMCCEMDKLFAEIFSPTMTPFGPTSLLATTWNASSELSGYSQQDAHEFFISALNQIHTTSRGSTNVSCNCIIHSTFAGQLQSDVKCERCGNVTSTVDPMLDISLELKGKSSDSDNTLASCLRRYTQPEKLAAKEYSCSKCTKASAGEASKRLSIRKLPPVLSFQFKRFEHKTTDKSYPQKIDSSIRFPASINMAPYTTLVVTQKAKEKQKENDRAGHALMFRYPGPEAMYDYDLFAVINHEGQIDNGHYTNYARVQDEWYRFDDDKVTKSNLGACLGSLAYMCFYVKRHLDYKPYMTPTYVLARETEAVREKEMEQEKERARIKEVEDALLATV